MIRNNTIAVRRARSPAPEEVASRDAADPTFVGVPVALRKLADGDVLGSSARTIG